MLGDVNLLNRIESLDDLRLQCGRNSSRLFSFLGRVIARTHVHFFVN